MGSRCSFCGTIDGPFLQVEGLFTLHMCAACQAARAGSNHGPSNLDRPAQLLAHHDPGPWYQWAVPCPAATAGWSSPGTLESHAAADHPGWAACYALIRPLPAQYERVVFRRIEEPSASWDLLAFGGRRLVVVLAWRLLVACGVLAPLVVDDLQDFMNPDAARR